MMGLLEVRDLELGKAVGEYLAEGPKATFQWRQRLDFRFFFYLWDPRTPQLDGVRVLMQCCAKHLRHDTKGIRFLTLHNMCFFSCKGGHNMSLLIVVFRVASPPKNSVRSLGRALDNRVTRVKGFVKTGRRFRRLRGEFSCFFL